MDAPFSFGAWLKQRRRALDLTQAELARQVGCATITLQKIERDERRPSKELAQCLAQVLQLPSEHHTRFVKVARAELALDRLALAPDPATAPSIGRPPQPPTNLLLQRSSFVGREAEQAQVQALLLRADVAVLTLTGPGGIGKTRLALEVAAVLRDHFAHGVWFVDLAPLSDPSLVASAITQALGVREVGGRSSLDSLKGYLRERQMLLLLDNFEQVVDAAPMVGELLMTDSELTVLVTSRAVLHLSGEHEYSMPVLTLPDLAQPLAFEQVGQAEAVRLFVARARAVKAGFTMTRENAHVIAEICTRLDGLPLAIELAAVRIKIFQPRELLERLGNRLALLTGGPRDLPARQHTIRNTIDWSYELLNDGEKMLFARLAVFSGGWTLAAVEPVCNVASDVPMDSVDGIAALVDKSLLSLVEDGPGEPRFLMLETIREYALERLVASGEEETLRRQHAAYYLAVAQAAWQQPELGFVPLEVEHDNLRAALAWSLTSGNLETGLRLCMEMKQFWWQGGYLSEGRRWLTTLLEQPYPGLESRVRAEALVEAAWQALYQGDYGAARPLAQEALAWYRNHADRAGTIDALEMVGIVTFAQGDRAAARVLADEVLALARELGDQRRLAGLLNDMGWQALLVADVERAVSLLEEAVALHHALDGPGWKLSVLHSLGMALLERGEYERVAALLEDGIRSAIDLGAKDALLSYLDGYAWLAASGGGAQEQQDAQRAALLFAAAEGLREAIGVIRMHADQDLHRRHLEAAKARLDDTTWEAAWAEGRAMTLEQAVAYALDTPSANEGSP